MVVAIGIMIKPISLKKYKLITIFKITEINEKINGIFVLCLANKKLEKTFINAKAGKPKAK